MVPEPQVNLPCGPQFATRLRRHAVTQDRQTHKPLRSIPEFEFEMFLLGPSDLILSCVCARGRARVIAASAPPQRSTDNRHWADVRFAECWGLSAHDRDGDAAGAPRVRWPGPHGGHRWGAEPCRTFIHTAPENPTWHNPTTAALQVSLSLLALLSALPNNTYGHVAAHCDALTRHIMTAIGPSQDATDIP